jgi:hypothetical protein
MKKGMIVLAMVLVANLGFCQEKIGSYSSSYFEGKEYEIAASKGEKEGDYTFYIDAYSSDSSIKKITLSIDADGIVAFRESLTQAKAKYVSWSKTAKENNVSTLDKTMKDVKFKSSVAYLYGSKWQFDFSVNYIFRAKLIDNQMHLIIQNKRELVSSSNQFIKSDGFLLVFESEQEINDFISKLDIQEVITHFNKKNSKEDLFQ